MVLKKNVVEEHIWAKLQERVCKRIRAVPGHFVLMQYTIALLMPSFPGMIALGMSIQMPMMQRLLADGFVRVPRDV